MTSREEGQAIAVGGVLFATILVLGILFLDAIPAWVMALPLGLVVLMCAAAVGWAARRRLSRERERVASAPAPPAPRA